jgi:hypothetical protein
MKVKFLLKLVYPDALRRVQGRFLQRASISELAQLYLQKVDFLEAAKIYQALSETISEKMDEVDDSDGRFGGELSDSFDGFLGSR